MKIKATFLPILVLGLFFISQASARNAVSELSTGHTMHSARSGIWTITADAETQFYFWSGKVTSAGFADIQPGMQVVVYGNVCDPPDGFCTFLVFLLPPYFPDLDPSPDYIAGHVTETDISLYRFTVRENISNFQMVEVVVPAGIEIKAAERGNPIVPITYNDLFPDMPIMIHGFNYGSYFEADFIVRSHDWEPEYNQGCDFGNCELFGIIQRKYTEGDQQWLRVAVSKENNPGFYHADVDFFGGFLNFPWGGLSFPMGAVMQPTTVWVSGAFQFRQTLANSYWFGPSGTEFHQPVTIEIRYFSLDGITDPDRVNLSYYDEETGKWRIATHMFYFPEEHCFRGEIQHFSRYSLSTNGRPVYYYLEW